LPSADTLALVGALPLFDDHQRDDEDYRRPNETTYAFLDRVSRPEFAGPRGMLNAWFDRWPADHREQLRARLMGKQPSDFDGAFWELYLHEIHARLGFTITIEPEIPDVPTRPDFLMEREDGTSYLEATIVGPSAREVADQRREAEIIAIMNEAYHPDFSVRLQSFAVAPQQVAKSKVIAKVGKWLATLDWSIERSRMTDFRREPHHIEIDGTHLFVNPYPRDPEVRGDRSWPTVVSGSARFGVKNEPPMIRDDLEGKASKFGRPERPYISAVLCQRDLVTELDVEQALFGPEAVSIPVGPDGPMGDPRLSRDPQWFWQRGDRKQATRVSAVLSAIHLHAWSADVVPLRLWHNPWATLLPNNSRPGPALEPHKLLAHIQRQQPPYRTAPVAAARFGVGSMTPLTTNNSRPADRTRPPDVPHYRTVPTKRPMHSPAPTAPEPAPLLALLRHMLVGQ
jgi:hypothetical protein